MPLVNHLAKPEIMSPAGYWPQLHAAIEAGADAVYFGLKHFTARAKVGFTLEELPDVMRTLHARGVQGYITFNTLVFDHEVETAARSLAAIAAAGADAIIVQDVGIAQVARRVAPNLAIHGSTQMSITHQEEMQLEQVYSRGLGAYFVTGTDHQAVVRGRTPGHRGLLMGRVVRVTPASVVITPEADRAEAPLKPGDGVFFDAASLSLIHI